MCDSFLFDVIKVSLLWPYKSIPAEQKSIASCCDILDVYAIVKSLHFKTFTILVFIDFLLGMLCKMWQGFCTCLIKSHTMYRCPQMECNFWTGLKKYWSVIYNLKWVNCCTYMPYFINNIYKFYSNKEQIPLELALTGNKLKHIFSSSIKFYNMLQHCNIHT